jgi:hypothetical protein
MRDPAGSRRRPLIDDMVNGDIFMGAFAGDQMMWNHFGYRTPIKNLYLAGLAERERQPLRA